MGISTNGINNILPDEKLHSDITCMEVYHFVKGSFNNWRSQNTHFRRSDIDLDDLPYSSIMSIVYKDKDHKKKVQHIINPKMDIYFVKPEFRTFNTPREYLEINKCYKKAVTPSKVLSTIVDEIKKSDDPISAQYRKIWETASASPELYQAKKDVLKWPYTLMSDIDIESYYRIMLGHRYNQMRSHTIDKAYLDIENDIFGLTSTETSNNEDPVNAVTVIYKFDPHGPKKRKNKIVKTYLLRNYKRYPQQKDFEEHLDKFIARCHKEFDKQVVIKSGKTMIVDCSADYDIRMYDSEAELLIEVFKDLNTIRPDTCEIWNIAYDIPKMFHRMQKLDLDPVAVMCDPQWDPRYQFVDLDIDTRAIDSSLKKTAIRMANTTLFLDQMQNYAGIRKGRKAYGSDRLDNIANIELGVGKWKFKNGIDVTNAAIYDYFNFVLYNIRDVWCQELIGEVTEDSTSIIYDMNQAFCPLQRLFKQITYNRQIYYTQRLNRGFVSGNNPNAEYGNFKKPDKKVIDESALLAYYDGEGDMIEDSEGENEEQEENDLQKIAEETTSDIIDIFEDDPSRYLYLQGGLVGNPDNNSQNGTELIEGIHSKHIFDDVLDMDFSSEYPWAKYTRSLSKSTQFGRLIIPHKISELQNVLPLGQKKRDEDLKYYTAGSEFVSDYISGDVMSFGHVWFGLPDIDELEKEFESIIGGSLT